MVTNSNHNKLYFKVTAALVPSFLDEVSALKNVSTIDILFEQKVTIKRSFYPSINYAKLLQAIGGASGLWLGVGVVQLYSYIIDIINFVIMRFKKNRE